MNTHPESIFQNTVQPNWENYGSLGLVVIQATTFCNLNCGYCYLPDRESKKQFNLNLIEPLFKKILSSRFLGEELTVCWHAGEPLTVPISFYDTAINKINEVVDECNDKKCLITQTIQTNGTLINQSWCDLFLKHKIDIGVSLDGPSFLHDAYRKTRTGLGTHASTMRGISYLQKNGIDVHVIAVLTQESLDYPNEIFQFFWDNGITEVGFNIEEIEGLNKSSSLKSSETETRFRNFINRFWELVVETNGEFKLREFEQLCGFIYTGERINKRDLNTPFAILNIDSQGNFSTFDPELLGVKTEIYGDFILGNIMQDTLESVCFTEKFQRMYTDVTAGVELCRSSCQYFGICGGGATSNKYWENGTMRSSETMACKYYQKIITDVILEKLEVHG
ncbi:cyclophane-forming radical SAM/SPASM peptide maturase GrrM/OscB [Dulcicalothrix desertica]|nr:cyclophane-forming radical SAM/SPASM peptide maturase GrrM/OscB [Dulcicalothrix desertica]